MPTLAELQIAAALAAPQAAQTNWNGAVVVLSPEDAALRSQRAFSGSTGVIQAAAGDRFKAVFTAGVRPAILHLRRFGNTSGNVLVATARSNPTEQGGLGSPGTGWTQVPCKTLRTDGKGSTTAFLSYLSSTADFSTGTVGVGDVIQAGGNEAILVRRLVMPGQSFGYSITSAGSGLLAAAGLAFTIGCYEDETIT